MTKRSWPPEAASDLICSERGQRNTRRRLTRGGHVWYSRQRPFSLFCVRYRACSMKNRAPRRASSPAPSCRILPRLKVQERRPSGAKFAPPSPASDQHSHEPINPGGLLRKVPDLKSADLPRKRCRHSALVVSVYSASTMALQKFRHSLLYFHPHHERCIVLERRWFAHEAAEARQGMHELQVRR